MLIFRSAPIKNYRAVSNTNNAVDEDLDSRLVALHAEISGRVVGPVNVETFNAFFPNIPDRDRDAQPALQAQTLVSHLNVANREEDMYGPLVCGSES